MELLLGISAVIFLVSAVLSLALAFLFSNFYKPIAPIASGVVKYSFIATILFGILSTLGSPKKTTKSGQSTSNVNNSNHRNIKSTYSEGSAKEAEKYLAEIENEESQKETTQQQSLVEQNIIVKNPSEKSKKAGLLHGGVHCPYCRSLDVQFMQNNRKSFSVGKAAVGTALTGGIGSLAGFAGKKGKKNQWRCNDCGRTFNSKK